MKNRSDLQNLFGVSAALDAAARSGLLAALAERTETAAGFADSVAVDARAAARVLDVLVAFGVAVRDGDRYAAAPALSEFATTAPLGMAQISMLWGHTPKFLATGEPAMRMDEGADERGALYANVVASLGRMFTPAAKLLASKIERAPERILDIGCGSGVWSLAIAERFGGAKVTGLDLPAVVPAFLARAEDLGLSERATTLPGDVHEVAIPTSAFDLVVVANVLRIEEPARAERIVQRAASALGPAGALVVVDAISDGTEEGEQALAVYALHLAMRTSRGRVYSASQIQAWMAAAGLPHSKVIPLAADLGSAGAVIATR